jgi:hypothetical protein
MATAPTYASTPRLDYAQITAANTARDGSGSNIVDVMTGVSAGTRIERIRIVGVGTVTAGVIRLFSAGGAEILLPSFRASANGAVDPTSTLRGGLVAEAGSTITVSGDIQFASRGSLALNNGGTITAGGRLEISAEGSVVSGFAAPASGPRGVITAPVVILRGGTGINLLTQTTGSQDVQILGGPTATRSAQ